MCMYVCLGHRYKQVRNPGTVQKRIANYDGKTDGLDDNMVQYSTLYSTVRVRFVGKGSNVEVGTLYDANRNELLKI